MLELFSSHRLVVRSWIQVFEEKSPKAKWFFSSCYSPRCISFILSNSVCLLAVYFFIIVAKHIIYICAQHKTFFYLCSKNAARICFEMVTTLFSIRKKIEMNTSSSSSSSDNEYMYGKTRVLQCLCSAFSTHINTHTRPADSH